jgi:3'(2'), 5'-bisphosphate nucleotidase
VTPSGPTLDAAAGAGLMDALTAIAAEASAAILRAAENPHIRSKNDGSPVTAADENAERIICDGLNQIAPSLPIISEEAAALQKPKPVEGGSYFLVDPLDGTREFIAGRDEYTVNIALVSDRAPILGIIAAPASGLIWRGIIGRGAERLALSGDQKPIAIHARPRCDREIIILASRSHMEPRTRDYLAQFSSAKIIQCGSSIKFCHLAEGAADLYPRLAPTHDWDIAAGHAILTAAGGTVTAPDGAAVRYGSSDLLVPAFIAAGASIESTA